MKVKRTVWVLRLSSYGTPMLFFKGSDARKAMEAIDLAKTYETTYTEDYKVDKNIIKELDVTLERKVLEIDDESELDDEPF